MKNKDGLGLVQVYTGDGKGKTTAALGLAMRAAGHNFKIAIIHFMKLWDYGEVASLRRLGIDLFRYGTKEFVDPKNPSPIDLEQANKALSKAEDLIKNFSIIFAGKFGGSIRRKGLRLHRLNFW